MCALAQMRGSRDWMRRRAILETTGNAGTAIGVFNVRVNWPHRFLDLFPGVHEPLDEGANLREVLSA